MTPRYAPSLLLAILLALAPTAPVLSQTGDDATEPRYYDVEIVIFKNLQVPRSREYVLPVSSPARSEPMLDLASPESIAAATEVGYELLPATRYRLGEVVEKLVESERYELLVHTAWRQPGVELDAALPIWIRGGRVYGAEYISIDSQVPVRRAQAPADADADEAATPVAAAVPLGDADTPPESSAFAIEPALRPPPIEPGELYELEGKITIALGRYLHTYADLVLRRPRREAETPPGETAGDLRYAGSDAWILNNHHLRERRRMRSRNLHYLDHPEFSLLVLIHPFDAEEEAARLAADAQDERRAADAAQGIVLDSDLTPTEAAVTSQGQ